MILFPTPTRQKGCACHKTSFDLWDASGKHLESVGSEDLSLVIFCPGDQLGAGSPYFRHRIIIQRYTSMILSI
jgi:hypothetical protein